MENIFCTKVELNKEIIALHKEVFKEDNASFFDALVTKPYYHIFAATQNDELVAYCIIMLIDCEAEIINIATKPEFRGLGIAAKLLQHVITNTKADKFFLEVNVNNAAAITLYKKCGFVPIGIRKNYYPDGDALNMQLDKR